MSDTEGVEVPTPLPPGEPPVIPPSAPVPRAAVMLIVLGFAGVLIWHIIYDARHGDYSGERITFFLGVVVFAMLGYDVTKLYRRNGDDP